MSSAAFGTSAGRTLRRLRQLMFLAYYAMPPRISRTAVPLVTCTCTDSPAQNGFDELCPDERLQSTVLKQARAKRCVIAAQRITTPC
eukprot:4229338-Amphidinium_carterae.1